METLGEVLESVHETLDEVKDIHSAVRLATVSVKGTLAITRGLISIGYGAWIFPSLRMVFNFRGLLIFASCRVQRLGQSKCKHDVEDTKGK